MTTLDKQPDGSMDREQAEANIQKLAEPAAEGEVVRQLWVQWADKVQAIIAGLFKAPE